MSTADKPRFADLVIMNGKVITIDKNFSISEAIAIRDERIIFVGKNTGIHELTGPKTKIIDLHGKPILPGINDTHVHVDSLGSCRPPLSLDLNYPEVKSIDDIVNAISAKTKVLPSGKWIRGGGWNPVFIEECKIDPKRELTKWDLDIVSPDHPIFFTDYSHHNAWVNSKALESAGITKNTPDPAGGIVVRDEDGEPMGILRENAVFMMEASIPALTKDEMKTALLNGIREMNINGITSFTHPLIYPFENLKDVYCELYGKGQLTARVTCMLAFGSNFEEFKANLDKWQTPPDLDHNWLQFPQIKIFSDGIPITKTSWMWKPYIDGGYGSLTIAALTDEAKYENLLQMIRYGHEKEWQLGIHACGDRAISSVLDGYESAINFFPHMKDVRHYIIHNEAINDQDILRSGRLEIAASMQPLIHHLSADSVVALLGPERGARDWPFASVLRAGIKLAFSSDAPVIPPDWRKGVQSAVLREGLSSAVIGPDECISREDAIRAYTINGAWQDHKEHIKGSIEVGKFADFCVLDEDILTIPAHEIGNISVLMTIVNGQIVYEKEEGIFSI